MTRPAASGRVANFPGRRCTWRRRTAPSEWAAIGLNYPSRGGDNLWMSGDGRAEIDYGSGQFRVGGRQQRARLAPRRSPRFALFVAQGQRDRARARRSSRAKPR
jgi:hypothetical protein